MLRITVSTSAAAAQRYYVRARQAGLLQRRPGDHRRLHGKAARRLKLPRKVTAEIFAALTENRDPATGETLTARQKENRGAGYDVTFCAPKGPSLLFAMTGDARIKNAFETAVQDTMREIERDMQARCARTARKRTARRATRYGRRSPTTWRGRWTGFPIRRCTAITSCSI